MSSTNKTTHYELSQYVGSDKPTYLSDYNGDMLKIDTGINAAKTIADTNTASITQLNTDVGTAQTTANTAVTNAASAQTTANTAITNLGTLANLTTLEKTNVVGAINEVNANMGNLIVNSNSQLTNKTYSCDYINTELAKKEDVSALLYTNTNLDFGAQTIDVTNLSNYNYIDVYFRINNLDDFYTTIKIKNVVGMGGIVTFPDTSNNAVWYRKFTVKADNKIEFTIATNTGNGRTSTTDCIPIYVTGHAHE